MITITFAELHLSSTVVRRTVIDGGFPVEWNGNTYLNDGLVAELDNTRVSADLSNVVQNITLFVDDDVRNHVIDNRDSSGNRVNSESFRNRQFTLFKGDWNETTSQLENVRTIYEGLFDTSNVPESDGTIEIIVSSLISPIRRPTDNIALQVLHNQRLADGVYGTANVNTTDTFLRNAGESFSNVTLGETEYVEALTEPIYEKRRRYGGLGGHRNVEIGQEIVREEIQASPGSQLEAPEAFQPPRVYGVSGVEPAVIAAWNHPNATLFNNNYGFNWRGDRVEDSTIGITPETQRVTLVYLLHAGQIDSFTMLINGVRGDVQSQRIVRTNNTTGQSFLLDEDGYAYACAEVVWGTNNQSPLQTWVNTSGGAVDNDFRGIGYVLVAVTLEATHDGAIQRFPQVAFQVRQTQVVGIDANANIIENPVANIGTLSEDTESPFAQNTFHTRHSLTEIARPITIGNSWVSNFGSRILRVQVSGTVGDSISTAYGLEDGRTQYNPTGVGSLRLGTGSPHAIFSVIWVHRRSRTDYSFYLGGVISQFGNVTSTSISFDIENVSNTNSSTLSTTRVEDQHPARVILDYLLDRQVGPGLQESDIDVASFYEAEQFASRIPQHLNGVVQGQNSYVDYIQAMADAANFTVYQEGSQIRCRYRRPIGADEVVVVFDDDNSEDIKLVNTRADTKFNEYVLTVDLYKDSDVRSPRATTFPIEVRDTDYLAQDNGNRNIGDVTTDWLSLFFRESSGDIILDETDNSPTLDQYEDYADFLMDISRYFEEIEVTTDYQLAKDLRIGSVFDVHSRLYNFTATNIRRYEVVEYIDRHDGTVTITGQRHSNEIFGDFDRPSVSTDALPPTVSTYSGPVSNAVPNAPLMSTTWDPDQRYIGCNWDIPTQNSFNVTGYQLQEQAEGQTVWVTISEQQSDSDRNFARIVTERGGHYKFRVRALTPEGVPHSPWSLEQNVRLDLAFGDNKPEIQGVVATGARSNLSVLSGTDAAVEIVLDENYLSDSSTTVTDSGSGSGSNLGGTTIDLNVSSNFISALNGRWPSSGTSTATGTNTISNGAGTVTVSSNFSPAFTETAGATTSSPGTGTKTQTGSLGTTARTVVVSSTTTAGAPSIPTGSTFSTASPTLGAATTVTTGSQFAMTTNRVVSGNIRIITTNYALSTDVSSVQGAFGATALQANTPGLYLIYTDSPAVNLTGWNLWRITEPNTQFVATNAAVTQIVNLSGVGAGNTFAFSEQQTLGPTAADPGPLTTFSIPAQTATTGLQNGFTQDNAGDLVTVDEDTGVVSWPALTRNVAASGSTNYSISRASGFGAGRGLVVDGTTRGNSYSENAAVRSYFAEVNRDQSGGTTYAVPSSSVPTDGTTFTISNLGGGITLSNTNLSHTYTDNNQGRSWDFSATTPGPEATFIWDPDQNDAVYSGDTGTVTLVRGLDAVGTLEAIRDAAVAVDTDITQTGSIVTRGTDRVLRLDLGTNASLVPTLTHTGGTGTTATQIVISGTAESFSNYQLTESGGTMPVAYSEESFVLDANASDRTGVIRDLADTVTTLEEVPDFDGNQVADELRVIATEPGVVTGRWAIAWDHSAVTGTGQGTLRFKTNRADADPTGATGSATFRVIREGVAAGTVNNDVYSTGLTTNMNFLLPTRDDRNFFAERAVFWAEGSTEPTVDTTMTNYTWREILSA